MLRFASLIIALCAISSAQEFRSTLSGRVTDSSGCSIPGAKADAQTSADGEYTLPLLAPGPYQLTVEVNGFKKFTQSGIQISTNQHQSALDPGSDAANRRAAAKPNRTNCCATAPRDMTRNRRVAYNPPVDAVSEVKVEAFQPDAAYGNMGGGTVIIPKLVDGRNKLFFFTFEGIKQSEPEPTFSTVATDAQKKDDFNGLLPQGIVIYDPNTAVLNNGVIPASPSPTTSSPPNRISPIGTAILGYSPSSNAAGSTIGENNRFDNAVRSDNFTS